MNTSKIQGILKEVVTEGGQQCRHRRRVESVDHEPRQLVLRVLLSFLRLQKIKITQMQKSSSM